MNKKFLYKFNFELIILITVFISEIYSAKNCNGDQKLDWFRETQRDLEDRLKNLKQNTNHAKNVIFFLGDGMSVPTVTAARIHLEQRSKQTNESCEFELDKFKHTAYSKTYCANSLIADSACSATAYLSGQKGNYETIGVKKNVQKFDCDKANYREHQTSPIAEWDGMDRKKFGLVTTTRVTYASPAGNYAHTSHRGMESDKDIKQFFEKGWITSENIEFCQDIAQQLIKDLPGFTFNVIFGGGRNKFLPNSTTSKSKYGSGERLDGEDLIDFWVETHMHSGGKYVTTRDELLKANYDKTNYILGLFADDHMKFNLDNVNKEQPSLAEMTEAAIKILEKGSEGFVLFVHGGHIDFGHHRTKARLALDETIEFAKAIKVAKSLVSEEDTLIVVTADHAHTMSISGYSNRNTDILGLSDQISDIDNLTYTTLSYANGEDSKRLENGKRKNLVNDDFTDKDYQYPANVPLKSETHGGDDVPVFASGPWAHLFRGTMEHVNIPHYIGFASCLGDGSTICQREQMYLDFIRINRTHYYDD